RRIKGLRLGATADPRGLPVLNGPECLRTENFGWGLTNSRLTGPALRGCALIPLFPQTRQLSRVFDAGRHSSLARAVDHPVAFFASERNELADIHDWFLAPLWGSRGTPRRTDRVCGPDSPTESTGNCGQCRLDPVVVSIPEKSGSMVTGN